jgi:hypothetical protein
MGLKKPGSRSVPETTKERQVWLENLQPGDLVHYCNGSYCDLYPIAVVVRITNAAIFTRFVDDLIWRPSTPAMKRTVKLHQNVEIGWEKETGAGVSEGRAHNFILPIEVNSINRWIQKDKEATIPDRYSPPHLAAFNALRFWLKQK